MLKGAALHVHSTFSRQDAFGMPGDMVAKAEELGLRGLAITDHGNTSAHPKLEMATDGKDLKPIYGVELYLNTDKQKKNHITILAKNEKGYQNLLRLSSMAYEDGKFYYMPCVDLEDVYEYQEGLVVLSGCLNGKISEKVLDSDYQEARELAQEMKDNIDDLYLEVQSLNFEENLYWDETPTEEGTVAGWVKHRPSVKVNKEIIKIGQELDIPLVLTNDSHFIEPEESHLQHFLFLTRIKSNIYEHPDGMSERSALAGWEDYKGWLQEDYEESLYTKEEYDQLLVALENQNEVCDKIERFELPKAEMVHYTDDPYDERYELLRQWCADGWVDRGFNDYMDPDEFKKHFKYSREEYGARMRRELNLIYEKGYVDYFLVVADMIVWAKEQGILVGPARGSAAGSLVSYCMGITEVNPMLHDLLFERFLDPSRHDLPDIDIDFQDDRRDEVKEYLADKYGKDHVENIAGYTLYWPKSLLDDVGRNYSVPRYKIAEYKDNLQENGGEWTVKEALEEIRKEYPQVPAGLEKLVGQLRGYTVHAAGVIVAAKPLHEVTTVMKGSIALDKRDAEYLQLLKIDALSLSTLRVISLALNKIGMSLDELYSLPLNDPEVYKGFQSGNLEGVFQFAGHTTRKVCVDCLAEYDIDSMSEEEMEELFAVITDVNTLSRPASLNNGSTARYIERSDEEVHPIISKHTELTRGQVIYQEQIMQILREGNLPWGDVNAVRKLITSNEGQDKLQGIHDRFINNLIQMGIPKEETEDIWYAIGASGAYGFNKSHSVSYSMITYYTMWLKVHYPTVFYWANMMKDPEDTDMLEEFIKAGGTVYPVRYGKSGASWEIEGDMKLRAGYITIKGIGPKTAPRIVKHQEKGTEPDKLPKSYKSKLEDVNAFDPDPVNPDYLGLDKFQEEIDGIPHRDKIAEMEHGDIVKLGVRIKEVHVKNLREFYINNGKGDLYDIEVSSPEKDTYVNMRVADETGEIQATINRFTYCDPLIQSMLDNIEEMDAFELFGEYNKNRHKVYVTKMSNITQGGYADVSDILREI